jgi:hypothetical protein
MEKVQYPAVLVLARFDHKQREVIAFVDDKRILQNDADLDTRLALYKRLEDTGAAPYTYTLAEVADADRVKAERVAWLEFEHGLRESPELEALTEDDALAEAEQKARQAFDGDRATLSRLDRAVELVKDGLVIDRGDGQWWVKTGEFGGVWTVNGTCTCPDVHHNKVRWCKHRLAVALTVKAEKIREAAGSAEDTPAAESAPEGDNTQPDDTTASLESQAAAIVEQVTALSLTGPWTRGAVEVTTPDASFTVIDKQLSRGVTDAAEQAGWRWQKCLRSWLPPDWTPPGDEALPMQYRRGRAKLFKD